jgi:hypothetical protein
VAPKPAVAPTAAGVNRCTAGMARKTSIRPR